MNKKQYIKSQGATCKNWTWSWSYINRADKIIIFGAFDAFASEGKETILSENWHRQDSGRKANGYSQSREHIRLIEEEDYTLKTFTLEYAENEFVKGRAKIKGFKQNLSTKHLIKIEETWYATTIENLLLPEQISQPKQYPEGASERISVNSYERNPDARKKCLDYYGYKCSVCEFDFEIVYGSIGKNYIHVHHIIPLSKIKKEYFVDPINDLIPVCPNCHAMLHRKASVLSVETLRKLMNKNSIKV